MAAVEEHLRATPASTLHARERPSDSKVEGCRGGGRMPGQGRQRTDAGTGAGGCCGGGDLATRQRRERKKKARKSHGKTLPA